MKIWGLQAVRRAFAQGPGKRFPAQGGARVSQGLLLPSGPAPFTLIPGQRIFTIGSCFAREIERHLTGFDLPCAAFRAPPAEWPHRPNGLLSEYSPQAMAQRIGWALDDVRTRDRGDTIVGDTDDAVIDLLLPGGAPVTRQRAEARRDEIDDVYRALFGADVLILTLGMVEVWRDEAAGQWLNRMPPTALMRADPGRYSFRRLPPVACVRALAPALERLIEAGTRRIILTVSPVPMQTTFSGQDCVTANSFSKAALRVAAEELTRQLAPAVDHFPSYEMVTSAGLSAFCDDLVHVRPQVVAQVMQAMRARYIKPDEAAQGQPADAGGLPRMSEPA
ncbi:MAG: GSCFA domain-containing protein [Rhodobacteraceae bacterium]|nr:GSCFA domain-containing protein [Paracoccaceae bacterium]